MSSFTREQYEEAFQKAGELFRLSAAHMEGRAQKIRAKALAARIMDMCEEVLGQRTDRPDLKPDLKNGGFVKADAADVSRLADKFKVR